MKRQRILALLMVAIAWGSPLRVARAQEPETPEELWPDLETLDLEIEEGEEEEPTKEPEKPADEPLTRGRVERTIAEIATLVNRLLNAGRGPRPSVDDLVAYYAPLAQVSYYYTTLAPQELQCLTREQYRDLLMDLAGSFPDPLQEYRYDYRIDRIDLEPDGSKATVVGQTFETIAINNQPVWGLTQAWTVSLVPKGDRALIQQEISSEDLNLRRVPSCPRPDFMSGSILEQHRLQVNN